MKNDKGFTLVEMLVAMGLFVIVLMITGRSFETILGQTSKLFRSEESNIEGVVGLEVLRHDLQQAGVGLYTEAAPAISGANGEAVSAPAKDYNDYPSHIPRAIVAVNNHAVSALDDAGDSNIKASSILDKTDYLVIKSTTVARNRTSQKWSHLVKSGGTMAPGVWPSAAENYKTTDERFVLLRKTFSTPPRTFIEKNVKDDSHWFRLNAPAFDIYTSQGNAIFLTYGVDDDNFRFPFNRADYFVARTNSGTDMPPVCAPNTGILYKGSINQADGKTSYIPLIDCVADMQVVLGWDMNLNGVVDTWSNADGTAKQQAGSDYDVGSTDKLTGALSWKTTIDGVDYGNDINELSTINIRNALKVVKIYLIVQEGRKDRGYTSPATIQIGDAGEGTLLRDGLSSPATYALSADMLNYHWKEYRIIVRPKNLYSNQ